MQSSASELRMTVTQQGLTEGLQFLSPLKSEVAHVKHPKTLANFRANAALGKQGLARQVRVGVCRYIHTYKYMCTALPRSFEAMLSAKLP